MDFHFKPLVEKLPSYIKDTTNFLLKLKSVGKVPLGSLLVTLDVCSLCTNIPHAEGIEACRELSNIRVVQEPPTEGINKLTSLILTKNNFCFNDKHYIQLKGMAMCTCMGPLYANIFMDNLKRRMLATLDAVPSTWWRYIDNIFAIWPHGEKRLAQFHEKINYVHASIKFTAERSSKSVLFLNAKVLVDDEGYLTTDLYYFIGPDRFVVRDVLPVFF